MCNIGCIRGVTASYRRMVALDLATFMSNLTLKFDNFVGISNAVHGTVIDELPSLNSYSFILHHLIIHTLQTYAAGSSLSVL